MRIHYTVNVHIRMRVLFKMYENFLVTLSTTHNMFLRGHRDSEIIVD